MSNDDNRPADSEQVSGLKKALLNSMWGYWFFLLAISFAAAGGIYLIWLKGNV
jgi:hypothetical protein